MGLNITCLPAAGTQPSHECVDGALSNSIVSLLQVPNYYKIITNPMDFSSVKNKLIPGHSNSYTSMESFLDDCKLIFKNCAIYNSVSVFVAQVCPINPLLGAAWPFVYFLQGRLRMAASFTRTYRFVCLAIVAKHLWCEQPVKEIQLTSICYVQICVYSSSYGDFLRWIDRRPTTFADSTRSDRDTFVRITIALIFSSPMNGHC